MKFQDLELRNDYLTNSNSFTYRNLAGKDFQIQVKEYLPVEDKIDLIQTALQKSEEDGIYNEMKLDVFFSLNIVYLYTNIEFSQEDREDEFKLYDKLEHEEFFEKVISLMGQNEYSLLFDWLEQTKEQSLKYKNTAAAVLRTFVTDLPKNAAAAKEIIDQFDPNKYPEVINFATAANGGRDINTQVDALNPPAQEEKVTEIKKTTTPSRKIISVSKTTKKD